MGKINLVNSHHNFNFFSGTTACICQRPRWLQMKAVGVKQPIEQLVTVVLRLVRAVAALFPLVDCRLLAFVKQASMCRQIDASQTFRNRDPRPAKA